MAEAEKKSKLTPIDIHNQEFKKRGRHGYDRYEVDSFLDRIVDDYGDVLDDNSDLRNQVYSLKDKNRQLEQIVQKYQEQESQLSQAHEMMQKAQQQANDLIAKAKSEIADKRQQAREQANVDSDYEKQQLATIRGDYERLKEQIAQFRNRVQKQLQDEIASLNTEDWQKELDQYFHTERFYPEDGEPIAMVDPDDDEDDEVDNEDQDEVDSEQEIEDEDVQNASRPVPMSGDSPQNETVDKPQAQMPNGGVTISFPEDYKKHE